MSSELNKSEIVIIAAHCEKSLVIGNRGYMPWFIPGDLKRFKQLTLYYPIIMGRKTFESLVSPLPNRENIVVSSSLTPGLYEKNAKQYTVYNSLSEAIDKNSYSNKVYIIGGASIYEQTLPLANTLELTIVHKEYPGDTYFPSYKHLINKQFKLQEEVKVSDSHSYLTYRRITNV